MGRFKYIPQEYNLNDENNKEQAMKDSDLLEINIKRNGEIVDSTIMVYDDYKIPMDITEELAKKIKETRLKILEMYNTIKETYDILEEASNSYEIFENKVFGKVLFDYNSKTFDYEHTISPMTNSGNEPFNLTELQELEVTRSWHEYNKYYINQYTDFLDNLAFKRLTEFTYKSDIETLKDHLNKTENKNYKTINDESDIEYELNTTMQSYSDDTRKITADIDFWNEQQNDLNEKCEYIAKKYGSLYDEYMISISAIIEEGDQK